MNRRGLFALALPLTFLASVALARQAGQPSAPLLAVVSGERAYLLGPAEQAAGPGVTWVDAAPKGRYLLCERRKAPLLSVPGEPPGPTEVTLISWDAKSRKASVLWRYSETAEHRVSIEMIDWFGGTATALARISEGMEQSLRLLNLSAGTVQRLSSTFDDGTGVILHPALPLAALYTAEPLPEQAAPPQQITLLRASGAVVASIAVPPGTRPRTWSGDGKRVYLTRLERKAGEKPRYLWSALDLSGKLTELSEAPKDRIEENEDDISKSALKLAERPATLTVGTSKETLPSLWLEGGKETERGLRVAAEIAPNSGELLPDLSAVAYTHQSALYVAPLISLDKTAYDELLKRAHRVKLLSDAKQVGLALMMYCQDYDEMFPPGGSDLPESVTPYLRNADLLKDFKFTYTGPSSLGKIENPAGTVLGHISGPGGRAVVYADGHAKWEDAGP